MNPPKDKVTFLKTPAINHAAVIATQGLLVACSTHSNPETVLLEKHIIVTPVLIGLSYLSIIYALSVTFGYIGKGLCVILVIMQIPGASGLYPIEMMPHFYRALYPLFPFTYSIDAFRETIGGFYDGHYAQELGKLEGVSEEEAEAISRMVGLGALKYFILKVDPKKNMTFNPKESIDFNGNTGPFIQYTHARIQSVLRKAADQGITLPEKMEQSLPLSEKEEGLVQLLAEFAAVVQQAGTEYNVSLIGNYVYELVKEYNQFYHDYTILKEENSALRDFRLVLSKNVALTIRKGMSLFGIEVPERM